MQIPEARSAFRHFGVHNKVHFHSKEELLMKRILVSFFAGIVLVGFCMTQSAQSQGSAAASGQSSVAGQSGAQAATQAHAAASQAAKVSQGNTQAASAGQLQTGSTMQAQLVKPLDAKKNKVGDEVIAKTTHDVKSDGYVVVPKGSKLVGHVTEVKPHSKEQHDSKLGIAFDRAILKNGTQMPITLSIQAIGRGNAASAVEDDTMATTSAGTMASSTASAGGGLVGGVRSTAGGVVNTAGSVGGSTVNTVGNAAGAASGSLSANSQGVVGLPGLSLATQSSTFANASVISSQGSNVHLDSGTEMILRVNQ
jgi:hypothetical protein